MQDNSLHRKHFYTQTLLHTKAFAHRSFYTEAITHKAFTHRSFYIQTLLHTDVFTHRRFYTDTFTHRHVYTQTLLHTDLFTHRNCFYTQTLWHTEAFTHRRFYTQALLHTNTFTHRRFYTQTLLHTEASTHKRFYTQTVLHTNTFTQKHFYTQTLLHTDGFTHKRFYTQSLVHTDAFTQRPSHVLTAKSSLSWPPQQSDGVVWRSPISMWLETSIYKHVMRAMCFGAPQPRWFAIPWKKYKRADLAGGERFWAGTHTVLQYDISWFFLGLGTWLLTVTGIETLILTLIHPSLYINTHTSISISYCYSYLNIKYIDLSLCGSSLPIHVIHPIPGPWLHANLAAQTNNYMRKRNRQLYSSSMESQPVLLDARRCTVVRQDALWWNWMSQAKMRASASLRQFCWLMLMHFIFKFNWHQWLPRLMHTDSLYAYVKHAESATDAPRASECSDWIFWSFFTNETLRVLIKTNVWHGISWISKMWLCRSMMVTCLHGARLSDSSAWNGPLNPLNVKIPLQLELKPGQNLLSRTLSRHQNEIVVMPSKIVVTWRRMKW